jgi:hypothetical protein
VSGRRNYTIGVVSVFFVAATLGLGAGSAHATLVQIPPSAEPSTPPSEPGALEQRTPPSVVAPALLQGLQGYTLVAGKTSALRVYLDDASVFGLVHRVEALLVRPDGAIGLLTWTGDEVRAVWPHVAPDVPASLAVRVPGTALDVVGRYRIEVYLLDRDGQLLHDAVLGAIDVLPTKDVRVAADRIWSGFPTKPGEYEAALEGLEIMNRIWPVRDGIAEFDQSATAGIRYMLNDNPQPMDAHLGPFFDSAHFRAPGLDFADLGVAYRFPNEGEGSGANASHNHNGLPFSVVVWGAPLGWVYAHESAHIQGLVPPHSPHSDGGVHSGNQFVDTTDAVFGYDPVRHRTWSDTMFDIMFWAGSGNEDSYGLSSWDWEFVRQSLLSLPSTGPSGPVLDWQSLAGAPLQSQLATAANSDGRREAFVLGSDGALHVRAQTTGGAWGSWVPLSGAGNQGPVRAWRMADGRLAVFVRAADQSVTYRAQVSPGGGWGSWTSLGATSFKGFALAENADGRLEVVGVGNDGQLHTTQQASVGGAFAGWIARGGVSLSAKVAAARNADGRLQAFVVGGDGVVYHKWQTSAGGGTWSDWANLFEAAFASAIDIDAAPDADGRLTVAIVRSDGTVALRTQSTPGGGFAATVPLGGSGAQAGFSLGTTGDGRLELFVVRSDAKLWHRHQGAPASNDTWTPWAQFGSTSLLPRVALGEYVGNSIGVFAVSAAGNLFYAERADAQPLDMVGSMSRCPGGPRFIAGRKVKLDARNIGADTKPGNDSLSFAGDVDMPLGWHLSTFAADVDGVHVRVTSASDAILLDASLTGAYAGAGTRGWKRAGQGLAYIDRTGSPIEGLKKAKIKPSKGAFNQIRFSLKGTKATYAISPADAPLKLSVSFGAIGFAGARNQCGETAFDVASCKSNAAQTSVSCAQ